MPEYTDFSRWLNIPNPSLDAQLAEWERQGELEPIPNNQTNNGIHEREIEMPSIYDRPRYFNCISCETQMDRIYDEYYSDEEGCCHQCADCGPFEYGDSHNVASNRRNSNRAEMHSYSWRPDSFKPKGNFPTEVLMGIELEVGGEKYSILDAVGETVNENSEMDSDKDHLYCKMDCSIYGVEIVSHPATLKWLKEWKGYDALLEKLRAADCYSDKSDCICGERRYCDHSYGLHVHVSRNAFKQLRKRTTTPELPAENETYEQRIGREMREQIRKQRDQQAINHQMIWLMFLERNQDKLNGEMKLARRDSFQYGAFKSSTIDELRGKGTDRPYYDESRYTAINCQNEKTYELRFFKSTVDTEEFYAAIEFADASVEFTRQINANDVLRGRALEWSNFVNWLCEQKEEMHGVVQFKYTNLMAQINALGLDN